MQELCDAVSRIFKDHLDVVTAVVLVAALALMVMVWPLLSRWRMRWQFQTAHYSTDHSRTRTPGCPAAPYDAMPRVSGPNANFLRKLFDNPVYLHQYAAHGHKNKGPVFRDGLGGPVDLVFLAEPSCVASVQRASGDYPGHVVPDAWTLYMEKRDIKRGLFFMDGPEWAEHRKILNQRLLKTVNLRHHFDALGTSTAALMDTFWQRQEQGQLSETLMKALYKWSLESISVIALGRRIGTFNCDLQDDFRFEDFVDAINNIFHQTAAMGQMPASEAMEKQTDAWCKFCSSCDTALSIASRYTEEAMMRISGRSSSERTSNCLLDHLINDDGLSADMATRLIADLFLAAADTTVGTAIWILYVMGRHRDHADSARQQLLALRPSVVDSDGSLVIEQDDLKKLSQCRSIIKETLRLYPVAPFVTRLLANASVIAGYQVPQNTMCILSVYSIGRDPKYFENPQKFDPRRWDEGVSKVYPVTDITPKDGRPSGGTDDTHESQDGRPGPRAATSSKVDRSERSVGQSTLASLPWGIGSRNCVGRTMAETQLTLFIAHLLKNFHITIKNTDIHMKMQMISLPSEKLDIELSRV